MKYELLEESDPRSLSIRVDAMLKRGWELYGSPFMCSPEHTNIRNESIIMTRYCQAMTTKGNK
jgi:hypothetical protein